MNEKIQVQEQRELTQEIHYTFMFELPEKERERRMEQLKRRLAAYARGQ